MQLRRGVSTPAALVGALYLGFLCGITRAAPVPVAGDPPAKLQAYAADVLSDLSTAAAQYKKNYRDDALKPLVGADATFRFQYSQALVTEFRKLLTGSADPLNALNAAIVLADPLVDGKANKDVVLCDALLNHKSAAVRYWAARGLANTLPEIVPIPGAAPKVIDALAKATKSEDSPLVLEGVYQSLAAAATSAHIDPTPMIADGLSHQADMIGSHGFRAAQSSAAIAGMQVVIDMLTNGTLKAPPATETVLLASASRLIAAAAESDAKDKANAQSDAPSAYLGTLIDQTNNFIHGVGASATVSVSIDKADFAGPQYLNVITALNKLSTAVPGVPAPPST